MSRATLGLVLFLVGALGVQTWRCERLTDEAAGERAAATTAIDAGRAIMLRIETQNGRLTAYKADRDTAQAALAVAEASARPIALRWDAKADDLAVYTPVGPDFCAQLVDLDREVNG